MRPAVHSASSGAQENEQMVVQFVRMGAPREQVQAALARSAPKAAPMAEDQLVMPSHLMPALQLASELRSQVRAVSLPGGAVLRFGLDYAARDDVMRALGLPRKGRKAAALLAQFRVIEDEMTAVANSRSLKVH